jgi:indolepyruvate ferredoxin oxidoreductase beta subunit
MNVVMLGALAGTGKVPVSVETLKQVVRENVLPKTIDANLSAFDLGLQAVQK